MSTQALTEVETVAAMNQQSRTILAVVLSMGVLFGYQAFFAPPPPSPEEAAASSHTQGGVAPAKPEAKAAQAPSPAAETAGGAVHEARKHALKGEKVHMELSNGPQGLLEHVRLLEGRFAENSPEGKSTGHDVLELDGRSSLGLALDASRSSFTLPSGNAEVIEASESAFGLRRSNSQVEVTQRVELVEGYEARYTVAVKNKSGGALSYAWVHQLRMGVNTEGPSRNLVFRALCGSVDSSEDLDWSDIEDDGETRLDVERPRWAGLDSKYFLGALVGPKPFASCVARPEDDMSGIFMSLSESVVTVAAGETKSETFGLYFGPKSTEWLDAPKVIPDVPLSSAVDWGWFGGLSKTLGSLMLRLMRWFHDLTGNWGLSIVMLTVVVKLLTLPLALKQYKSMAAMRELAPELKALQEKYGDDPVTLNKERQSLMTRKGVNPLAGCFPLIVQFPVWIALYAMLGTAVELYHEPFLWLKDLTKPDPMHILPLALGGMSFLQMQIQPAAGDPQQQAVMKWMMPIIFLVMMWFLPSGLGIYMLANITLTLIQSYIQFGPARREAKAAASK